MIMYDVTDPTDAVGDVQGLLRVEGHASVSFWRTFEALKSPAEDKTLRSFRQQNLKVVMILSKQ